ncbi:MAG TPA: CHAT domain-containing protein [Anaerolineae bacterium]|nr:CHAT domain-containing protein [Anaerolineae bacterium]
MTLPPEITVTVRRVRPHPAGGDQYFAVTTADSGVEICRNLFRYPPDAPSLLEPLWATRQAARNSVPTGRRGRSTPQQQREQARKQLAATGQMLYGLLFGSGREISAVLRYDDHYSPLVRLTLAVESNATPLWRLPWEALHDGTGFLLLSGRFLFSRHPLGFESTILSPTPPPLRLLVVLASPDDERHQAVEEEIAIVQAALEKPLMDGRLQVKLLDDATLSQIGQTVRSFQPHVLHYIGQGVTDPQGGWSFLILQRDNGDEQHVHIGDLLQLLRPADHLQLVLLCGCHTLPDCGVTAFTDLSLGLLQVGVPAVMALQSPMVAGSSRSLGEAFYGALAHGDTVAEALQSGRVLLHVTEEGTEVDWPIPTLYLRDSALRLVDPRTAARMPDAAGQRTAALDVGGLPLPAGFVGRKSELRLLRSALRDETVRAACVRSGRGMGKSSLAAGLLQGVWPEIDGALVVRCSQVQPDDIPLLLSRFLARQGQGPEQDAHTEAAALLAGQRQPAILPPIERAVARTVRVAERSRAAAVQRGRQAAGLIAGRRYIFVLDGFDTLLDLPPYAQVRDPQRAYGPGYPVADPVLAGLLEGLLDAGGRSLWLFTSRQRWNGLDEHLAGGEALQILLPPLTPRQSISVMDSLPHLRREPLPGKEQLSNWVGGHPGTIELVDGCLLNLHLRSLLSIPLDHPESGGGEEVCLGPLLDQLSAGERQELANVSSVGTGVTAEGLCSAGLEPATVHRWLDLSLLRPVRRGQELLYEVPSPVREALRSEPQDGELRSLHLWAAGRCGRPYVEEARRQAAEAGRSRTEPEIEETARREILLQAVHQTGDMARAYGAMLDALQWQHHLLASGEVDAANEIVIAVWPILDRWGQTDRANELLLRRPRRGR